MLLTKQRLRVCQKILRRLYMAWSFFSVLCFFYRLAQKERLQGQKRLWNLQQAMALLFQRCRR